MFIYTSTTLEHAITTRPSLPIMVETTVIGIPLSVQCLQPTMITHHITAGSWLQPADYTLVFAAEAEYYNSKRCRLIGLDHDGCFEGRVVPVDLT